VTEETNETPKPTKWQDPAVPAGNATTMPAWPLATTLLLWLAWVAFLAAISAGVL